MHPADLEDPFALNWINDPSGIDGRAWLDDPRVRIGSLSQSHAASLIEELYRRGAFRVVICDVGRTSERDVAASIVVQRNGDAESWRNVFEFCRQVCDQYGWWQNPDGGQALLLLRVDGDPHQFTHLSRHRISNGS